MSAVTASIPSENLRDEPQLENQELLRWQRRLLPFMTRFIVVLALAFFALSVFHLFEIGRFVEAEHGATIRTVLQEQIAKETSNNSAPSADQSYRQALVLLEAEAMDRRYHQANALLMSRIWTKQLAFITGMVLAFLGAMFILGKLSEARTTLTAGASDWKTMISSSSPGIIMAFFGTVLLVVALVVQTTIAVQDNPVYVYGVALRQGAGVSSVAPGSDGSKPLMPPDLLNIGKDKKADNPAVQPKAETQK
jgi:hypothetical protein